MRQVSTRFRLMIALALGMFLTSNAIGQEWARFRGVNGAGVSKTVLPAKFTPDQFNWKVKLPGIGHSCPVLWGDKVFLLSADPKDATRYMLCHSAKDGRELWRKSFASEKHHLHARSSYASCTPAVDADFVYVAWSTPAETLLKAFDHDGNEKWSLDLGSWTSQHGFGTSPILYKDLVILSNQQQGDPPKGAVPGKSRMMAFDRKTGKEVWVTDRVTRRVCYSVPFIHQIGGKDQLICLSTGDGVYSLDPNTGKPLWSAKDAFSMRTVGSPITAGGLIFGSTGSGKGGNYVVAVKPGPAAEFAYRIETQAPYVPTMISKGNLVFLWFDKGIVTCIEASNGEVHWRERVGGGFSGSPVIAGDKIYCISEDGELVVLAASKEYKLLGRSPLGEASRSTPAIAGGRMYLRTYSQLISVGDGS